MMTRIILATITDLADFGKKMDQEAFADRPMAEAWAARQCEELKANSDDPEYCSPSASFDSIWLTQ